jgi:hypothetical protein
MDIPGQQMITGLLTFIYQGYNLLSQYIIHLLPGKYRLIPFHPGTVERTPVKRRKEGLRSIQRLFLIEETLPT